MEFHSIPDDIWIEIFSSVDSPAQLAVLMCTCRRFHDLASKPLLRDLQWCKPNSTWCNLEAWKGVYRNMMTLPRKLTVGVPFDFSARNWHSHSMSREMILYDMIHSRIPSFTSLYELVLDGTVISPFTYSILAAVPSLRSLSIHNCSFVRLYTPFASHDDYLQSNPNPPSPFPFSSLPITHLSLQYKRFPTDENNSFHTLQFITASALSSLSLMWTGPLAAIYADKKWSLNVLTQLDVVMPLLTRDLVDCLVDFVQRCPMGPRIRLRIEKHNLSEQQIGTVQFPLRGVWSYQGPLAVAAFSPRQGMAEETLTRVVMNEPLELTALLDGLEKLPQCVEVLEIQVRRWDIELLFAIRQLFPGIRSLVVRYGRGVFPVDFFVTLGANILFDLPNLHTLKLIADPACITSSRQLSGFHTFGFGAAPGFGAGGVGGPAIGGGYPPTLPNLTHMGNTNTTNSDDDDDIEDAHSPLALSSSSSAAAADILPTPILDPELEQADLKDYLIGWNRYCKNLRCVQLAGDEFTPTVWERRFEGDRWVKVNLGTDVDVRGAGAGAEGRMDMDAFLR